MCGVYTITNTTNGKVYVGSSKTISKRLKEHLRLLRQGTHKNIKLQRSFNKHGESSFELKQVFVCDEEKRFLYEQIFIDFHSAATSGYNINPKAERGFSKPLELISAEFFTSRTNVNQNGCHVFTGGLGGNGMAKVKRGGVFVSMQRLAYEHYKGAIPDGMRVYRTCKNRACVNPDHIVAGNAKQIAKHTFETGRVHPRGNTLLNERQVMEVKLTSTPATQLAKKFGVSSSAILAIRKGKTWRHVNVRVVDEDAESLEPFVVVPVSPVRVWG